MSSRESHRQVPSMGDVRGRKNYKFRVIYSKLETQPYDLPAG
jgi:hypothetical protein